MSATNSQKPDDPEVENVMDKLLTSVEDTKTDTPPNKDADVEITVEEMLGKLQGEDQVDYHEQVLEYLMNQEQYIPEEDQDENFSNIELKEVGEETAKQVLAQLLTDVDNITSFKEAYAEKKQLNNQFELFDLTTRIPNFHISKYKHIMKTCIFKTLLFVKLKKYTTIN